MFPKSTFVAVGISRELPAYREDWDRYRLFLLGIFRQAVEPSISFKVRPGKLHSASENRNFPLTLQS